MSSSLTTRGLYGVGVYMIVSQELSRQTLNRRMSQLAHTLNRRNVSTDPDTQQKKCPNLPGHSIDVISQLV